MDFMAATQWVTENKAIIYKKANCYCHFGPYESVDYLQIAYEASFVASNRCQEKGLEFRSVFWSVFKTMVRDVTPHPKHKNGSNSIPSDYCSNIDDENVLVDYCIEDSEPDDLIVLMFLSVCDYLPPVEREVLALSLGITGEGILNKHEIAKKRRCSLENVKQTIRRSMARIELLIHEGIIKPVNVLKNSDAPFISKFSI
jgi:hypothetical protein